MSGGPSKRGAAAGRRLLLAGVGLALLAAFTGCGPEGPRIVVGSKNFTEQDLLGELVATWIERTTDLSVSRRLHLGGTFVCHQALVNGEIDLYVEYTGTALTAILGREPRADPEEVYGIVADAYRERFDLEWTEPLGFENTFAIIVRRSTRDSLDLRTISDAAPHADEWTAGMGYEFVEREDGLPGLRRTYDLDFAGPLVTMELGLIYSALSEREVDVIAGNSTDGQVSALDLTILEDDRGYFPPYDAVPVVRGEALERHPDLRPSLRRLGDRIDTEEMRRLNEAVDEEDRGFREVARDWVDRELSTATRAPVSNRTDSGVY